MCVACRRRAGAFCPFALERPSSSPPRLVNHPRARSRRLGNLRRRSGAISITQPTDCPAPPPPSWPPLLLPTFSLALGVHVLSRRFPPAAGELPGVPRACVPLPRSLAPPPTTCCELILWRDLGTADIVTVLLIVCLGAFPHAAGLGTGAQFFPCLWRVLHSFCWVNRFLVRFFCLCSLRAELVR